MERQFGKQDMLYLSVRLYICTICHSLLNPHNKLQIRSHFKDEETEVFLKVT